MLDSAGYQHRRIIPILGVAVHCTFNWLIDLTLRQVSINLSVLEGDQAISLRVFWFHHHFVASSVRDNVVTTSPQTDDD